MSPLIKHLCNLRNKGMKRHGFLIDTTLQERINNLLRENQVRKVCNEAFKHRNRSKGWWDTVNKMTGRKSNNQMISSIIELDTINSYMIKKSTPVRSILHLNNFQYLVELECLLLTLIQSSGSCLTRNEPLQALNNSLIGCGKILLTSLHL